MSYEVEIRGTRRRVKIRSVWSAVLLPILTLGIYHLVWWYRINRELRDYGEAKGYDLGRSPLKSLLAVFPGVLIIVPAVLTYRNGVRRIQGAARIAGLDPPSGWIALLSFILAGQVVWGYLQLSLNRLWELEDQVRSIDGRSNGLRLLPRRGERARARRPTSSIEPDMSAATGSRATPG